MNETAKTGMLAQFRERIIGKSSVEKVADDPALMAELLLLVRMSFADRKIKPAEAMAFKSICSRALGLNEDDAGDIVHFLDDFGYETTNEQAAHMLSGLSEPRRREIMEHMATIARSDGNVSEEERVLFHETARQLGLE